jgi:hypothetical protein
MLGLVNRECTLMDTNEILGKAVVRVSDACSKLELRERVRLQAGAWERNARIDILKSVLIDLPVESAFMNAEDGSSGGVLEGCGPSQANEPIGAFKDDKDFLLHVHRLPLRLTARR